MKEPTRQQIRSALSALYDFLAPFVFAYMFWENLHEREWLYAALWLANAALVEFLLFHNRRTEKDNYEQHLRAVSEQFVLQTLQEMLNQVGQISGHHFEVAKGEISDIKKYDS